MKRAILHSDMNAYYASVEMMLDPGLRGKAIAVCGSTEERHGIVLAKSQLAKQAGVKTGMVNWEARQKCPGLIMVQPHYDQYLKYSRMAQAIYQRYTDRVEPYGMDECWLDVTECQRAFGTGMEIAEAIRATMREELGLTVSIGVAENKIFAKLGSDMKKPDAITEITAENFREKVWPLPASDLLYVGRATTAKLLNFGITTIGELAHVSPEIMKAKFGINGLKLLMFARGEDKSQVMHMDFVSPIKSVGHGITCNADLLNSEEVWKVMLYLSQDIGHRLRLHDLAARGVQITIRDETLWFKQWQAPLLIASQSPMEIALLARRLFDQNYKWGKSVRSVTVRAINLVPKSTPQQLLLFDDNIAREKRYRLEDTVDEIRGRFGPDALKSAALMKGLKIADHSEHEVIMPGMMYG